MVHKIVSSHTILTCRLFYSRKKSREEEEAKAREEAAQRRAELLAQKREEQEREEREAIMLLIQQAQQKRGRVLESVDMVGTSILAFDRRQLSHVILTRFPFYGRAAARVAGCIEEEG